MTEHWQEYTTFRERTDAFWFWFAEHEEQLADFIVHRAERSAEEAFALIAQGTALLHENLSYHIGGDYEFTFAAEGNRAIFYLLPYLVARMPAQYRDKWTFFPYLQSSGGKSFGLGMHGQQFDTEQVMISLSAEESGSLFTIRFYEPQLLALAEQKAYHAFYIMLENTLGEGMCRVYINQVEMAQRFEHDMFPLPQLEERLIGILQKEGREILTCPSKRFSVYQFEPKDHEALRYDVLTGTTCWMELIQDYYANETEQIGELHRFGAEAVFLMFPFEEADESSRKRALDIRYEIEDRLQAELLGEADSGREIGLVLGGASGIDCMYIDLLLYDRPLFQEQIRGLLADYPYAFYLSPFQQNAELEPLFSNRQKI